MRISEPYANRLAISRNMNSPNKRMQSYRLPLSRQTGLILTLGNENGKPKR